MVLLLLKELFDWTSYLFFESIILYFAAAKLFVTVILAPAMTVSKLPWIVTGHIWKFSTLLFPFLRTGKLSSADKASQTSLNDSDETVHDYTEGKDEIELASEAYDECSTLQGAEDTSESSQFYIEDTYGLHTESRVKAALLQSDDNEFLEVFKEKWVPGSCLVNESLKAAMKERVLLANAFRKRTSSSELCTTPKKSQVVYAYGPSECC
ncbi:hypothetical protein AB6A40_007234 [Gnathostoma spinigerum]|uniref:Uncharacterized protein n=1 Tax=Gnathostoma spinigerum TaxID=75299 RepID=A0ABD6EKL9_9BILA